MIKNGGNDACSLLYVKFQIFSSMTLEALMTFDKDTMDNTLVLADELLNICSTLGAQVIIVHLIVPLMDGPFNGRIRP